MIYQSLIVRHILFNITIELTSSWDISSESSSPSIKRNRLELRSFSFLSFRMAISKKKKYIYITPLVERLFFLAALIYVTDTGT